MFRATRQIQCQHAAGPQTALLQIGHYRGDLLAKLRVSQALLIADQRRSRLWDR